MKALNPNLFDQEKMIPEVRNTLINIVRDFIKQYHLEHVKDVILTGSNANYHYRPDSDIDLHIIVDYTKTRDPELIKDYFKLAKKSWNNDHDIKICNHEVELYVQDAHESHVASGIYSLRLNEWLKKPNKNIPQYPKEYVDKKVEKYKNIIQDIRMGYNRGENIYEKAKRLLDRLASCRKAGLNQKEAEFSLDNLVFKEIRADGYIDLLHNLMDLAYDRDKSIECNLSQTD